ncbi:MAG: T9SS type A sorting domain-containing protein, partial [Cryomorphaceae bacterium]
VRLGNGGVDFGSGNPTTIEGILEVSAGGFVINNSCHYDDNSILRFANGFSYEVDEDDKTWDSGDITPGNPGVPYNVESSGDNATILTLNSPRSLRKNLTINGSQFTLTSSSGTFELGGNWNRSGASSEFNHNDQEVVFNGAYPQTIATSDGVASEVFYKLTFSGAGLKTLNEDVTVEDAITIDGAGGLDLNEQTIFLYGDWINAAGESAFDESGRVELIGSEAQTITCTGGEKFDTLRVNNSSALGEGIDLVHPISISGQLIMDSGLIHNDGVQDLTLTATASTNGGDYRSYATGKIVKQGFATTDLVEFPVGYFDLNGGDTISVWQKAGLTPENADATEFSVQYFHENAVPGTSYPSNPPEVQSPLLTASTCNFWDIDRLTGASGARIRLHWNDSTSCFDIGDPATLVVAHLNGSDQWESAGMDGQSSISPFDEGYVESDMVTSFSPFAIGTTSGMNVLPITLLNFTAEAREATVELRWTTSSEINNDFFTVERSLDAGNFEPVGTIAGAGNSNTQLYYNFSDDAPYSGISFYRLKQTDYDGTATYSDIRMVRMDSDGDFELLKVYPAQDGLQLHYRSEVNDLDVEIIDLTGKRLFRKHIQNTGATTIHPGLARGVYLLRISNGTEFRVGKFFY